MEEICSILPDSSFCPLVLSLQYSYSPQPQQMVSSTYSSPTLSNALPPATPSSSSAVPYLMPMGPGQQPMVGYIVPYEQVSRVSSIATLLCKKDSCK